MKKLLKRFLAINLVFAMVLISFPMSTFAVQNNGRGDFDDYSFVVIKNSQRTASITYNYDGINPVVVTSSSGVLAMIPKNKIVTVTVQPKNNTPFGGSVKYRTTNQNSQVIALAPFVFTAGAGNEYSGIITEVTSWKEVDSEEARLESVFPVTGPSFDSDTYTYNILVKSLSNKPDLNPVTIDPNATFVEQIVSNSQTKVVVTAEDGESTKTYIFNFVVREKPVIRVLGDNPTIFLDTSNLQYTDGGAKAIDADSDEFPLTGTGTVDRSIEAIYTVSYNYTDDVLVYDGNVQVYLKADTATRKVEVKEYVYIVSVEELDPITVYYGTNPVTLPTTVVVKLDNGEFISVGVTFDSGTPVYDGTVGSTFSGMLNLPEGINNPNNLMAEQEVIVKNYIITDVEILETIEVYYGDASVTLVTKVEVTLDDDSKIMLDVSFDTGTPVFDGEADSIFIGELSLIDGVTNPNGLVAEQKVVVKDFIIIDVEVLETIEVFYGDTSITLVTKVEVTLDDESKIMLDVSFNAGSPVFDGEADSIFIGVLTLIDGVSNPNELVAEQEVVVKDLSIVEVEVLETIEVYYGNTLITLVTEVEVTLEDESKMMLGVTFDAGTPVFEGKKDALFIGTLTLVDGITNPNELVAEQEVIVKDLSIVEVEILETIEVYYGNTLITQVTEVEVTLEDESKMMLEVTFDAGTPVFDGKLDTLFIGTLTLVDGITNPNELVAEQSVVVLDIEITSLAVQPLIEVFENTPLGSLGLAQTVVANLNHGGPVTLNIILDNGNPIYNEQDNTSFTGTLVLPEGIMNPLNLQSVQNVKIVELIIVDIELLEAVRVAEGTMSSYVVPTQVLVTLNDQTTMLVDVDLETPFALTNDINLFGSLINLPEWLGNPNNIKASKDITVEKTIIVDEPEATIESEGVVLEIGFNKSYDDGSAQLYFDILPDFPEEFEITWEIESDLGFITLSPTGFVEGLNQGTAIVKITVVLDNETILIDTVPVQVVFFATPVTPTSNPPVNNPSPNISLDRNEVELEVGTEALEEFSAYNFTETIINSSDFRVTWAIKDSDIATVDENGVVTALKEGETTVTVTHTSSGDTAAATIIVFLVGDEVTPLGAIEFFDPYIYGYPDQSFGPQKSVTRAEVAAMFARILKLDLDLPGQQEFSDVQNGTWYFEYIQAIAKAKIFVGDANGNFRPNEAISRGEIASVFAKYWMYLDIDVSDAPTNNYSDVSTHWASDYIYQVHNAGIVAGFADGTYKPNDSTLREQIVGMINTLIERPEYLAETTKFTDITKAHWAYGNIEAATQFYMVQPELPVEEQ